MCRVGQNHINTVYIWCFWQGNHHIYGHIWCIYTVLANPIYVVIETPLSLQALRRMSFYILFAALNVCIPSPV